ncbi:hypothetical protein CANMA_003156 [Candida margitis]|uniref:uncharacterized protein n=1 Tax=Candida margitis TaxID=1775924 RepID=UPI0022280D9A|nr:uncharacterized protein CANMA_003156 [Candida margitis]KAI5967336.1 hypothetical protein CANMA_003156 [Candida margitis]
MPPLETRETIGRVPVGFREFKLDLTQPVLVTPEIASGRESIDLLMSLYCSMNIRLGIVDLKLKFPQKTLSLSQSNVVLDFHLVVCRLLRNMADGDILRFRDLYYIEQSQWSSQGVVAARVRKLSFALNIELNDLNAIPDTKCVFRATMLRIEGSFDHSSFPRIQGWLENGRDKDVAICVFEKRGTMNEFNHQATSLKPELEYICICSAGYPSHTLLEYVRSNAIYLSLKPEASEEIHKLYPNEENRLKNLLKSPETPLYIKLAATEVLESGRTMALNEHQNLGYYILNLVQ